ncbi:MAG: preprotein translocase subunit SecA [Oscillospiraceae bacterium]|jgi:preprotein translocase subunit SecA|nr:preprotein translocase subunit SecA [Oscillospiraceae bacterium]
MFLKKIFKSYSAKELKRIEPIKEAVLSLAGKFRDMSDDELKGMTGNLKERAQKGATLDELLPEAFATCVEATDRVLGMRHFPVQILGGIVLHQGRIAEMKTGEGKTLVATLPSYLNAIGGGGVHIVTVNDYLAKRDAEQMGKIHRFLGLNVGVIVHELSTQQRRVAYNADITYGTNNELGFDYLKDNMVQRKEDLVQRAQSFAIVDEVDSILIDEARTPLIISGPGSKSTELYQTVDVFARTLDMIKVKELDEREDNEHFEADYIVDESAKTATLTKHGIEKAEKFFGVENLIEAENITLQHHINQAIKAYGTMTLDVDYVIKEGEIVIVDEFTGRLMQGRRYSEGLHQAIEAKERVTVQRESQTLATITFQNFFRLYKKLAGMTGTALTEESEFRQIYNLDVVQIPPNKPMIRTDHSDAVYKTEAGKYGRVIQQITECNAKGQPVLVGTVSIEKSEQLGKLLRKAGVKHEILNAKQHEKEAEIIAQAGKLGAVTIATNMAGRGTDIILGGNAELRARIELRRLGLSARIIEEATGFANTDDADVMSAREVYTHLVSEFKLEVQEEAKKVVAAGGLFIIGTERHESRRIDNQLRGRAGRQGDPGESRFFLSFDDSLIRLFSGERMQTLMTTLGFADDEAIENKIITNAIEKAQRRMEGRNFEIRKTVLQFDDVMNKQREIIYQQRSLVLQGADIQAYVQKMLDDVVTTVTNTYLTVGTAPEHWNLEGLRNHLLGWVATEEDFSYAPSVLEELEISQVCGELKERIHKLYAEKEAEIGPEFMRELERNALLHTVDSHWVEHIDAMHELKRGIHLRSYAQRDPVVEYRLEGFEMFDGMIANIQEEAVKMLLLARPFRQFGQPYIESMPASSEFDELAKLRAKKRQKADNNDRREQSDSEDPDVPPE